MIRGPQFMQQAPVMTFPDVFLSKVLEQGFGCQVRQDMVDGTDCRPGVQKALDRVIATPMVSRSLDPQSRTLLQPLQTFQLEPNGFPKVSAAAADALVQLMILHDPYFAITFLKPKEWGQIDFVRVTEADLPWFRLLHSLELYGVVTGVQEFITPVFLKDGNVGGEKKLEVEADLEGVAHRVFTINRSKLAAYRAEDRTRFDEAIETVQSARRIDEDAVILLKQLSA